MMGRSMRGETKAGFLFIAPQMLGYLIFVLGPAVAVFVFSLHERNMLSGQNIFVGLENYRQMFQQDPIFYKTMFNTLIFTGGLVPLGVSLALLLALLSYKWFFGVQAFRTIIFAPVVTSAVAWAIVWRFLLQGQQGAINQILSLIGIAGPDWLRNPSTAMVAVIVTRVVKNVGMNVVIFVAAIANLPEELFESARIDGANDRQIFFRIKMPLLMPTTLMVTILVTMGSLKVFDHIMLMTQGGPENSTMVLVYYIYYQGFRFFDTGYASALAVVLFAISLFLAMAQWKVRRRVYHYEE